MKDIIVLFRWDEAALGLTGWGAIWVFFVACILGRR